MNYIRLFNDLKKEGFPEGTALLSTIGQAIHLSTEILEEDFETIGNYTNRVEEKIKEVLWQHPKYLESVLEIRDVLYDYEIRKQLNGLGGCEEKTIVQLIKEKQI